MEKDYVEEGWVDFLRESALKFFEEARQKF
jgi:hypothetical protein